MGTDMSLNDLNYTLDYTAERSYLTAIFWWDSNTNVYPTYKYMQTYTLTCPSDSLSVADSDLKGNPLAHCYIDKVRVTPCTSFCTWQLCRSESQGTSADSSSSSYPYHECLCTRAAVRRTHLKLQVDPFMCGLSEYWLWLNIPRCCKLILLQTVTSSRMCTYVGVGV